MVFLRFSSTGGILFSVIGFLFFSNFTPVFTFLSYVPSDSTFSFRPPLCLVLAEHLLLWIRHFLFVLVLVYVKVFCLCFYLFLFHYLSLVCRVSRFDSSFFKLSFLVLVFIFIISIYKCTPVFGRGSSF